MWELYGIITWLVDIQTIQTIHKIDISVDERNSDPWDNSHRFWLLWLIVGEEWWINRHFELSNGNIFWSSNMEIGWKGIHHVYIDSLVFEVKGSWDFLLSAWITGGRSTYMRWFLDRYEGIFWHHEMACHHQNWGCLCYPPDHCHVIVI